MSDRTNAQRGSVLLIVNPFGGDTAFLCDQPRDHGASSNYEECSIQIALAILRDRQLQLIKCEHRIGSPDSWRDLFDDLDQSMVLPRLIIAVDSARSALWAEAVASAPGDVFVVPSSMSELLLLLS